MEWVPIEGRNNISLEKIREILLLERLGCFEDLNYKEVNQQTWDYEKKWGTLETVLTSRFKGLDLLHMGGEVRNGIELEN